MYYDLVMIIPFLIIGILLFVIKRRILHTETTEDKTYIMKMICGGIINDVHYTRPFVTLLIYNDRVVVRALLSTIVCQKDDILAVKSEKGVFSKGVRISYRGTSRIHNIVIWTDAFAGSSHMKIKKLLEETFLKS